MPAAWLASGVAFYYSRDEDWSLDYAVFFAVNAGLGVGYGDYVPDRPVTKVFTVCFSVVGTSLILGGLVFHLERGVEVVDGLWRDEHGAPSTFQSIPEAAWWCRVTATQLV